MGSQLFPSHISSLICFRGVCARHNEPWQVFMAAICTGNTWGGGNTLSVYLACEKVSDGEGARLLRHLDGGVGIQSGRDRGLDRKIGRINGGGGALVYNTANQMVKNEARERRARIAQRPGMEAKGSDSYQNS